MSVQERIDELGFQPLYKAYQEFAIARVEFMFRGISFYIVLAALWYLAQSEQPMVSCLPTTYVYSGVAETTAEVRSDRKVQLQPPMCLMCCRIRGRASRSSSRS